VWVLLVGEGDIEKRQKRKGRVNPRKQRVDTTENTKMLRGTHAGGLALSPTCGSERSDTRRKGG